MRKTVSIIAASLLTATVVFTGCGGGGSSVVGGGAGSSSSSSSSSEASSSSAAPMPQRVVVSDGYVLQADVTCGANQAAAVTPAGTYEFAAQCSEKMVSKGGYIDLDANGAVDNGEPKAPMLEAPATFTNINPFSTIIANGISAAELAQALGLPADTNFDAAVPMMSDAAKIKAYELSLLISTVENKTAAQARGGAFPGDVSDTDSSTSSFTNTTSSSSSSTAVSSSSSSEATSSSTGGEECLPGQPCGGGSSSEATSSSAPAEDITTLPQLAEALKTKGLMGTAAILGVSDQINAIENAGDAAQAEGVLAGYLRTMNGAYGEGAGESSSTGGEECLPGQPCGSSSAGESSNTGGEECLPGQPCGGGSSSEMSSSSEGAFPGDQVSSSSEISSYSEMSSSSSSSSTSANQGSPFPGA